MAPVKGKPRFIRRRAAVPQTGTQQQPVARLQCELALLFEHPQRSGDHQNQLIGVDHPRRVPSLAARNKAARIQQPAEFFHRPLTCPPESASAVPEPASPRRNRDARSDSRKIHTTACRSGTGCRRSKSPPPAPRPGNRVQTPPCRWASMQYSVCMPVRINCRASFSFRYFSSPVS